MTIQELADQASVTTRTIRYYVEQGVLPPPGRGRPSEYTAEHVRLLDLIRRLKEQYLPLEEIRDILQRLTPDQVEDFLRRTEPPGPQQGPQDSAADYISQVLTRGALRTQLKEQAPYAPPAQPAPVHTAPQEPAPAPSRTASPVPPPLPRRLAGEGSHAATDHVPAPTRGASPPDSVGQQQTSRGEERTWQRVTLAPGVELHYEPEAPGAAGGAIRTLIEAARTILGSHPEKGTEEQT
jgi:DNA-binding transcriptional MerR regulator